MATSFGQARLPGGERAITMHERVYEGRDLAIRYWRRKQSKDEKASDSSPWKCRKSFDGRKPQRRVVT